MSTLTRKEYRGPFVDLFDWLESPLTMLRPLSAQTMRVEDYVKDGRYVVRAELPGLDPEKDLVVTVSNGILSIKADRQERTADKHRTEFRYGSFARHMALPAGADEDHVQATYDKGILEIMVELKEKPAPQTQRKIPVRPVQHIKPT
jgi:HSP20 family molecular chaperone IbpA